MGFRMGPVFGKIGRCVFCHAKEFGLYLVEYGDFEKILKMTEID